MNRFSLLFCVLVASALSAPIDDSNPGGCPGGLANGELKELGRFFYECRDGSVVPKGCLNDDLKRMEIGGTFDRRHERLQCRLGNDGLLTYDSVSCLFQGAERKVDEQWEDGSNFYTCQKTSEGLRSINAGCIDQGRRVQLNEKVPKDDFVYVCNQTVNNGARMMPVACVKDGRQYNEGEAFELGKFWYTCTRTGREKLAVKPSGCVNDGRRLNDGDRYTVNDVIYECTIDTGKNDVRTVACVQTEGGSVVERKLGCSWTEGQAPFQYEWTCKYDEATKAAKKVQVRCQYNIGVGVYQIDPGCYRIADKAALGCLNDGSALRLQSFQGDNAEQSAIGAGLRAC